jgi:hypothetical protein
LFDNNSYNLLMQLTQEHKTIWRIKNEYKSDAAGCPECHQFWEKLEKEGEQRIARLEELLMKYKP